MISSPFKFLDSYTREDIGSFFGRERETDELFRLCFTAPMLVVYGGSGTGKTSLVQCGLQSKFNESDWLPVLVRRSGDLLASLSEAVAANTLTPIKSTDLGEQVANLYLDHFKPIYFLFDQFEELFIFGTHAESEAFFTAIKKLLEKERNAHVIFIVREEYLAELTRYERIIPGLIENRYRVERMARSQAMNVVEQLCARNGITCGEGFSAAMVDRLNPEGQGVELSYLQVYLDRCWRTRQNDEPFSIALLERIGYVDDLLGAFLDEQVADTPDPQRAENLLKAFVSDQGTKRQLTTGEAHEWVNAIGTAMEPAEVDRLLQVFVTKRLLKDRDEGGRYELLHDALARQIFQRITRAEQELIEVRQFVQQAYGQYQKRGVKLTTGDLVFLRPYRNQLYLKGGVGDFVENAFGEADRKSQRRKWKFRIGMTMLLAALIAVGIYAGRLQRELAADKLHQQSIAMAERAMKVLSTDPFIAYLIAEKAFQLSPTFESEKALVSIYPFLYPEIARFRASGIHYMPVSKAFVTTSVGQDSIAVYGEDGVLKWSAAVTGLRTLPDVWPLDTSGLIVAFGDSIFVFRMDGTLLCKDLSTLIVEPRRDRATGRFVLATGRGLVVYDPDSGLISFDLDMIGESLDLREAVSKGRARCDLRSGLLTVEGDSSIRLFDLRSRKIDLLDEWVFQGPILRTSEYGPPNELIVLSGRALHHLRWDRSTPIEEIERYDYLIDGFSERDVQPIWNSGIWGFEGSVHKFYSPTERQVHALAGLMRGDEIVNVAAHKDRCLIYRRSPNERGIYILRSFDGRWQRVLCSDCGMFDLRVEESGEMEYVVRSPEKGVLRAIRFDLDGDTLNDLRITIPHSNDDLGNFMDPSGHVGLLGSMSATHRTKWALTGRVQRLLLPPTGAVGTAFSFENHDGRTLLAYSDTLVSLISRPFDRLSSATPGFGFDCAPDSSLRSIRLSGDLLTGNVWNGSTGSEHFRIRLKGGVRDSVLSNSKRTYRAAVLGRRWAKVVHGWEGTETGYLVDMDARSVLDTGIFGLPARYESGLDRTEILRIRDGKVDFLDGSMRTSAVCSAIPSGAKSIFRSGRYLTFCDSLRHGVIGVLDIRTRSVKRRILPLADFDPSVRAWLLEEAYAAYVDTEGTLFISGKGSIQKDSKHSRILIADIDGNASLFRIRDHELQLSADHEGGIKIKAVRHFVRKMNGGYSRGQTESVMHRYDRHSGSLVKEIPSDVAELVFDDLTRKGTVQRMGRSYLDLGTRTDILCGGYLYSNFRAVDHYERFPLYGADVIKEVREDKKFGEFWKHIDIAPLLKQTLQ